MSRVARDSSWHVIAFVLVFAGLSIFAPLAWWQKDHGLRSGPRPKPLGNTGRWPQVPLTGSNFATEELPTARPQLAPIGPLVADQITLDPSIQETPAMPAPRPALPQTLLPQSMPPLPTNPPEVQPETEARPEPDVQSEPPAEMRLSAISRPSQPLLPPAKLEVHQPIESLSDDQPAQSRPQVQPIAPVRAWPEPTALVEQVKAVAELSPAAAAWSAHTLTRLSDLIAAPSLADRAVAGDLAALKQLADEAKGLAQAATDDQSRSKLLRAGYALVRRLVLWDMAHTAATSGVLSAAPIVDQRAWTDTIHKVDSLLQATGGAAQWRKYLLIDRAVTDFDSHSCSPVDQRQLARDILHRLHSTQLSREQEKFVCTPPFQAFSNQLKARAAATPDLSALLAAMERHEQEDSSAAAKALAAEYDLLRWSSDKQVCDLAEAINAYYRNANVRVALSIALVNRMIPQQTPQWEPVEDNIVGAWVSGQSHTSTKVQVRLVPDKQRWNIALEAEGQVASDTASSKGPATFYQRGWSFFKARKNLTVDRRGIRLFSAEVDANANNDLNDFETDFDGIPLLGGLVRAIARNQYDANQPAAKVEVEGRIVGRASSQLDTQVAQRIEQSKQDLQTKLLKPMRDLSLEPTPVEMETTANRLIARYRIASREQASAFSPRPQAPSDSMLSVQIHESAMNNVLEQLHLGGRRNSLIELFTEMTERFSPTKKIEVPEDLPDNVFVTFAQEDPVRIDCQDGRVRLTIHIAELAQQGTRNRWTNFTVHAYYAPSADQLDANLYRDGIIELIGDNRPLPIGQRAALTAIFARVLSRNRKLHIINEQIAQSPQLQDQQVTQFVIHDGWMGIALGPKAPGRQAAMHPRPALERE